MIQLSSDVIIAELIKLSARAEGTLEERLRFLSNGEILKSARVYGRCGRVETWKVAGNQDRYWREDFMSLAYAGRCILTAGAFPEFDMETPDAADVRAMLARIRRFSGRTSDEGARLLKRRAAAWTDADVKSAQEIILAHRSQLADRPEEFMQALAGYNPTPTVKAGSVIADPVVALPFAA